jgi:hypothetical protein
MTTPAEQKILVTAFAAASAAIATSEYTLQSGEVYVDGKHYTPGAKLQLTASQAKRLGDSVKPA